MLATDDLYQRVYSTALRYLSLPRTTAEVKKKLSLYLDRATDDYSLKTELLNRVILSLTDEGLIDDSAYSDIYVKQRINSQRPSSRAEITKYLLRKGIDNALIKSTLVQYDLNSEANSIRQVIAKKAKHYSREKLIKYLVGRGFSYNQAILLVDEYLTLSEN